MLPLTEGHIRLYEKLRNDLGEKIMGFLQDCDIHEIMANPNGELWVESSSQGQINVGHLPTRQSLSILNSVAGIHELIVSPYHPRIEAELPYFSAMKGQRFCGAIPPVVTAPCFTIRKRSEIIFTLNDYVASHRLKPTQAEALRESIRLRKNILVCGGPGSGKTTLANALIQEIIVIDPRQRLLILEDLSELQCHAQNCVVMLTSESVHMRNLLHTAMRMRPDRILIGEVRGAEALDLLKAWNTGCPGGICTTHANSAESAIQRIADLSMEAGLMQPPWTLLEQTIHMVVSIHRRGHQPGCVEQIVNIKGRSHEKFLFDILG